MLVGIYYVLEVILSLQLRGLPFKFSRLGILLQIGRILRTSKRRLALFQDYSSGVYGLRAKVWRLRVYLWVCGLGMQFGNLLCSISDSRTQSA